MQRKSLGYYQWISVSNMFINAQALLMQVYNFIVISVPTKFAENH